MKLKIFCTFSILFVASMIYSQGKTELISGKVTFLTSKSVYVKFKNTAHIKIGDTLQISTGTTMNSCLVVNQKSSTSCVCSRINDCEVKKETAIFFKHIVKEDIKKEEKEEDATQGETEKVLDKNTTEPKSAYTERIRGRVSAATYSSLSASRGDRHRMMYRLSLNAAHINNSKFSAETYINYRQNFIPRDEAIDRKTKFFRVYNLALRYDVDSTFSVVVGRKINNKTSSLGAIDGLQAEKFFGKNYIGVIAGFRPDIFEYSFNPNLLEYGAYIGRKTNGNKVYAQSTLGLLEQRNSGAIDRRYVYFQHSSTLLKKLSVFGSFEMDIYNKVNEVVSTTPRLTNLYASLRYRLNRRINFSVSYDTRKRILYYETLKTEIERLLDDDEARQGVRFRVNVKPLKYVNVGASYSKRFQSDNQNKSENINGFASWSKIPGIGGRLSLNFNMNSSNYLESKIISLRHSRSLIKKKLNADFYFRMVNYKYLGSEIQTDLQYYGVNLSYRINRKMSFSVLGEMAAKTTENTYRINAKIIKRFDRKK